MGVNGLLFAALDIRPMLDVLWSTPTQPYLGHVDKTGKATTATRMNLEHGLAMTVLSTGPVGERRRRALRFSFRDDLPKQTADRSRRLRSLCTVQVLETR